MRSLIGLGALAPRLLRASRLPVSESLRTFDGKACKDDERGLQSALAFVEAGVEASMWPKADESLPVKELCQSSDAIDEPRDVVEDSRVRGAERCPRCCLDDDCKLEVLASRCWDEEAKYCVKAIVAVRKGTGA